MSRKKRNHSARVAATSAGRRARRAAAQVKPVAAQVKPVAAQMKPLAQTTGAAAIRRVRRTRAWAAPRVERTGQVLQDSVAPKVSAWLSVAARRLEPAKPQRPRWRKLAGISVLAAAAGAAVGFARNRKKPDSLTSMAEADAGNVAPTAAMSDGQAMGSTDADADVNGQVRTS
jgi:hypothetical protein